MTTNNLPKLLIMGDSISIGYRRYLEIYLHNIADVYYPWENARMSTYLLRYLSIWKRELGLDDDVKAVLFNTGLWDLERVDGKVLVSPKEYKRNIQRIVDRIRFLYPNAVVYIGTITDIKDGKQTEEGMCRINKDIVIYNNILRQVAKEKKVSIIDINGLVKNYSDRVYMDATHFDEKTYNYVGESLACELAHGMEWNICNQTNVVNVTNDLQTKEYIKSSGVVIYGAGDYGRRIIDILRIKKIEPQLVIDKEKSKEGMLNGIKVVCLDEYVNSYHEMKGCIHIVCVKDEEQYININRDLSNSGVKNISDVQFVKYI